jgi:hypothetical protein
MGEDNRLVFSYLLDRGGGGQTVDWQKIKQWSPEEGTLWMHLNHASENVQKWLTEQAVLTQYRASHSLKKRLGRESSPPATVFS